MRKIIFINRLLSILGPASELGSLMSDNSRPVYDYTTLKTR